MSQGLAIYLIILCLIPAFVMALMVRAYWRAFRGTTLSDLKSGILGLLFFILLLLFVGFGTGFIPGIFGWGNSVNLDENGQPEGCVNNYMGSIDC